jgi:2-polyprenyl-3-methyl-5-hydroxy-6-metoxy-1,4-benzoquinol methylase
MNVEELKEQVDKALREKRHEDVKTLLFTYKDSIVFDNTLAIACYLCPVYEQEKQAGQPTIFSKVSCIEELLERYTRLNFHLFRIEQDVVDDGLESFNRFLVKENISSYELLTVLKSCAVDRDRTLQKIRGEIPCAPAEPYDTLSSDAGGDISHEKEFCFIICTNNKLYEEECLYYIRHLRVPKGYHVDALTVEEAGSMTAGYNEAMQCSEAKYKVYLHQDTFIINPDFMADCLKIFRQYPKVGMLGNVGALHMPKSGIMWKGERERYGMVYDHNANETTLFSNPIEQAAARGYLEVDAVDGLIMVTQYDIPWREDLFDKWDFYDCSQSMEFIRHGFQVAVPQMEKPWCIHDCGFLNLDNYDTEKEKFVKEYMQTEPEIPEKVTVVLTVPDRRDLLEEELKWLEQTNGITNIIIAVNGSGNGAAQWLSGQPYEYLWFDEGVQGYGKVWNAVLENFEPEEHIVFVDAGVYPEKNCIADLASLLQENVGAVSPVSNDFHPDSDFDIRQKSDLDKVAQFREPKADQLRSRKVLEADWRIWAVKKSTLEQIGPFREELCRPENVLADYELRMIQRQLHQLVCQDACVYEAFGDSGEIYPESAAWRERDRTVLKKTWDMNYFNLSPSSRLVAEIGEEPAREFKVLEIGCDLGATLFEIKNTFPNCRVYGMDINEAAVNIAKSTADVRYGNIDELHVPFTEKFDYIIFGDVLEHLHNPAAVVGMCRDILNENGVIIASIPNVMHISVMEALIDGRFLYADAGLLDRTHIHLFTFYEIMCMFDEAGYKMEDMDVSQVPVTERQKEIEKVLLGLSDQTEAWMYEAIQYIVKARRQ